MTSLQIKSMKSSGIHSHHKVFEIGHTQVFLGEKSHAVASPWRIAYAFHRRLSSLPFKSTMKSVDPNGDYSQYLWICAIDPNLI